MKPIFKTDADNDNRFADKFLSETYDADVPDFVDMDFRPRSPLSDEDARDERMLIDRKTFTLVRNFVPREDALSDMADFFSALSDGTRIKILSALSISPMCVNDLSTVLALNQTTVSHQLKNLRSIGVVRVKRQGKVAFYSLSDKNILDVMMSAVNFL